MTLNLFNSLAALEPKCPNCGSVIDYGVTTEYDEDRQAHVCRKCRSALE